LKYDVVFTDNAKESLMKMDAITSGTIISWIEKNIIGKGDPRRNVDDLADESAGVWRYRLGDYRLYAKIVDRDVIILAIKVRKSSTGDQ